MSLEPEQTILPLVDEALQHTTTKGIAFQDPEIVARMDLVRQDLRLEPFYWKLPEQFEGKKVRTRTLKSHENKVKHVFGITPFQICLTHRSLFYFASCWPMVGNSSMPSILRLEKRRVFLHISLKLSSEVGLHHMLELLSGIWPLL